MGRIPSRSRGRFTANWAAPTRQAPPAISTATGAPRAPTRIPATRLPNGAAPWKAILAAGLQDELFRLLIETSKDYAVFVVDLEGGVLTSNVGAERVAGYAEREIIGQSSFLFFTPEDRAAGVPKRELQTALRGISIV
jgi:PAS domain-containing protein